MAEQQMELSIGKALMTNDVFFPKAHPHLPFWTVEKEQKVELETLNCGLS